MRLRSAFCFGVLSLRLFMSDAEAQSPERLTLANRLLDAMDFDNTRSRFNSQTVPGRSPQAEQAAKADAAFTAKYMGPKVLRQPLVEAYATLFTAEELRELVAFYESPTGRKLTKSQPELANALQGVMSRVYRDHLEEYSRDVLKIPQELLKPPE
jgi:hypothetical protein